ncbi:hypothetical protein NDU88_002426 [Pleurodeles waltl]|uniref:Uncharacterized protein n=1 Tax=Pleurodeles waltl TaxID=8319 RepID=A0AAV7MSR0_PLEWA|nr:hypothetical protein NDU88_002426 [Pleurodeles waltl]
MHRARLVSLTTEDQQGTRADWTKPLSRTTGNRMGNEEEEGGDCFDYIMFDEELKVCLVTEETIQESVWLEEMSRDVILQEILDKVMNGCGVR